MKTFTILLFSFLFFPLTLFSQSCFSSNVVGWKKFKCEPDYNTQLTLPTYFRACLSDINENTNSLKQMMIYDTDSFIDWTTELYLGWYDVVEQKSEINYSMFVFEINDFIDTYDKHIGDYSIKTIGSGIEMLNANDGYFLKGEILRPEQYKQDFTNKLTWTSEDIETYWPTYIIGNAFPEQQNIKFSDFDFSQLNPYTDRIEMFAITNYDVIIFDKSIYHDGNGIYIDENTETVVDPNMIVNDYCFWIATQITNLIIIQKSPIKQ